MKVLSVIPSLTARGGGPVLNLVESCPYLHRAGIDLTIFTTDIAHPASAKPFRRAARHELASGADECDVEMFRSRQPSRFAYAPTMGGALRRRAADFDVIRIHGVYLYPHMVAASAARKARTPYIVTPHGALDPWLRRQGRPRKVLTEVIWQNRMLADAAALHATTLEEARLLQPVAPARVPRLVIGNGVATDLFQRLPARGPFRLSLGLAPDAPLVLFLGRISRKKGIDILIRAFRIVVSRFPDARLALAGPDDEGLTPQLLSLARALGVESSVRFTGPIFGDARLAALADADVWALASHTENFGNAIVEAQAAGVPVVISNKVNLAPEIALARAGRICRPDHAAFASAIVDLILKPSERSRLAEAGRAFALRFAWPSVAGELAQMFKQIADTSGAS